MERQTRLTSIQIPECWKLIRMLEDGTPEEIVLRLQGVICGRSLPPIKWPFVV